MVLLGSVCANPASASPVCLARPPSAAAKKHRRGGEIHAPLAVPSPSRACLAVASSASASRVSSSSAPALASRTNHLAVVASAPRADANAKRVGRGSLVARRRATSDAAPSSSSDDSNGSQDQGANATTGTSGEKNLPAARSPVYLEHESDGIAHGRESNEFEAALLVTGTAVGGGSLALPYFCAAGGFFPAIGLLMAREDVKRRPPI